ncbi:MAG: DNA adenine methylase [SAR202 cluster bacterium]|nr:DNA adenine methylase [SAR202 cluster bacterium]
MTQSREEPLILDMPFDEAIERFAHVNPRQVKDEPAEYGKATPFIKWAGGKRSVVNDLTARFPKTFNKYWEPFVGGGALFFGIQGLIKDAVLSDANLDLTITYNAVKRDPVALIRKLEAHAKKHNETYYYRVRSQHDLQDPLDVAARFIYLNKTCFNGLYRVNNKGEFNVPIGGYDKPDIAQADNIPLCSTALQKTQIEYREFDTIQPSPGDLVYCDPPYHSTNGASFTKYTKLAFGEQDQERLRDFAVGLHRSGVNVILSNADTPLIRSLYKAPTWHIGMVKVPRQINSNPDGRGPVDELIITNYTTEE